MCENLGIPEENRVISKSPTMKELKDEYMKLLKKSRKHTHDGVPHVILVYVGGHGATQDEK